MTRLRWDKASERPSDPARIVDIGRPFERNAQQRQRFLVEQKARAEELERQRANEAVKAAKRGAAELRKQERRVEARRQASIAERANREREQKQSDKIARAEKEKALRGKELGLKLHDLLGRETEDDEG